MHRNVKRLLALILSLTILAGLLAACGGGKEVKPILPEVKNALGISSAEEKEISKRFEAFDSAFETLAKNSPVTDEDFRSYAEAIDKAADGLLSKIFDEDFVLADAINSANSQEEKDTLLDIGDNYTKVFELQLSMMTSKDKSAEAYAEVAVNLVNAYSILVYGEPLYTDDDLDRIG